MATSFSEFLTNYCTERCGDREYAEEMVQVSKEHPIMASMKGRWEESVENHPPAAIYLIRLSMKRVIEDRYPNAWFKTLF